MTKEREKLIALWQGRSAPAKTRCEVAAKRAKQLSKEVRGGSIPAPDGGFALRHALKEETAARREYMRLMNICRGILRGEIPDEEEWLKSKGAEVETVARVPGVAVQADQEGDERYRTLFELCPVAVYSCDAFGVIQKYNRKAAELWGREPEPGDTDERFCGSFKLYRPDGSFMPHEQCPMADVLTGKLPGVSDAEVIIERPDVSRVTVIVNIAPLIDERSDVTGAINCFYDVADRKKYEQLAKESAQQRLLLEQIFAAQEQERQRIARELHDEAGQLLTAILVGLKRLERSRNLDGCKAIGRETRELAQLTLDELRRLARGLNSTALVNSGLHAAISTSLEQYADRYGIHVHLSAEGLDSKKLPDKLQITLYRIVQEALTNVARHAKATKVSVKLKHLPDKVEIRVSDDGCGFDTSSLGEISKDHLGLRNIRERTTVLGGIARITSGEKGTKILVRIPLDKAE